MFHGTFSLLYLNAGWDAVNATDQKFTLAVFFYYYYYSEHSDALHT